MKTLAASFFTTTNLQSATTSLSYLLPWNWRYLKTGKKVAKLEKKLAAFIEADKIYSFWNGRSALYHALSLLNLKKGDEVILQAFTCVSVPNTIIQTGATPIYCDIDDSLNIDPSLLVKKITAKTKAVIIQHTFGFPADITKIRKICRERKLILIEDCAHALGAKWRNKPVGSFGDLAIFSFGRDKVISSVTGGFLAINNPKLGIDFAPDLQTPPLRLILQNLLYSPLAWLASKTYDFPGFSKFTLGKVIIFLSRKLKLIPEILTPDEKKCCDRSFFYALPNCLARLGLQQLAKIDRFNWHRQKISNLFTQNLDSVTHQKSHSKSQPVFLRHAIFIPHSSDLINHCRQYKIILGDWYRNIIDPRGVDLLKAGYRQGSCPRVEQKATQVVNLPNHPNLSLRDAQRIIQVLQECLSKEK